ncbi:hypothetical protein KIM372_08240 [Bombiscardovia nodaiensis]|uniref:Uncharacterized protein n=1 Tax=Bombiscardovia nodaiensis TaxID=2932181 RepID=A0ABN6S9V3_9BIFI|nr:hypothetical protein KIM372_08240 [Bombiscardovia nodaiensis]
MIEITRLWPPVNTDHELAVLDRPRTSMEIDWYVWSLFEEHIVIPKKIMQSSKYDYVLVVALSQYDETARFFPYSPYNGELLETATMTPIGYYRFDDYVNGVGRTKWFSPQKFWINGGDKTALISAKASNVNQDMSPLEYADLLFNAFAATLLYNFKKVKKAELDSLKASMDPKVISSFPFPARFEDQDYQTDQGGIKICRQQDDKTTVEVDIPSTETFYKDHFKQ